MAHTGRELRPWDSSAQAGDLFCDVLRHLVCGFLIQQLVENHVSSPVDLSDVELKFNQLTLHKKPSRTRTFALGTAFGSRRLRFRGSKPRKAPRRSKGSRRFWRL